MFSKKEVITCKSCKTVWEFEIKKNTSPTGKVVTRANYQSSSAKYNSICTCGTKLSFNVFTTTTKEVVCPVCNAVWEFKKRMVNLTSFCYGKILPQQNKKEPCVSCNTRKKETVHHQASAKQKTLLNVEINKNQDIRFFFEELVVKTILLISASDDNFDYRESTYLKQWVKTLLSYYPENSRNQVIERINSYIKKYIRLSYKGISILHNDLKYFKNLGNNKLSFELIEVCLDAILADHVIKDGELKMLNEVAESLDISKTKFTKLKTKSLSISKLNNTSDENIKALIGITIDMSKEDILNHLKREFKRWNQVAGHKDPEKREQAEEMLHHLANLRKNYS